MHADVLDASLQDLRSNGLPPNEGGENHMSKQIANQGSSKPNPGDVQAAANKPASKPTYVPPGH